MTLTEVLTSPLISKGAIATTLWPDKSPQTARVHFHNKLYNRQGKKFSENEIEQIKEILKKVKINFLV